MSIPLKDMEKFLKEKGWQRKTKNAYLWTKGVISLRVDHAYELEKQSIEEDKDGN
jgi:hypothetical protein